MSKNNIDVIETSLYPDQIIKTGSKTYYRFLFDGKKYDTIAYRGGFRFKAIFNKLNKIIPPLPLPNTDYDGNYIYEFKDLYLFKLDGVKTVYKYDISKAYKTILSIFWKNIKDEKDFKYLLKSRKNDFNKAIGYSAYHKTVYDARTYQIVEVKKPERPDILYFCTRFLKELKNTLLNYTKNLCFVYVDSFGFADKDINEAYLNEIALQFQKQYYSYFGLNGDYNPITFHKDIYEVRKNPLFWEFFNETDTKHYARV